MLKHSTSDTSTFCWIITFPEVSPDSIINKVTQRERSLIFSVAVIGRVRGGGGGGGGGGSLVHYTRYSLFTYSCIKQPAVTVARSAPPRKKTGGCGDFNVPVL